MGTATLAMPSQAAAKSIKCLLRARPSMVGVSLRAESGLRGSLAQPVCFSRMEEARRGSLPACQRLWRGPLSSSQSAVWARRQCSGEATAGSQLRAEIAPYPTAKETEKPYQVVTAPLGPWKRGDSSVKIPTFQRKTPWVGSGSELQGPEGQLSQSPTVQVSPREGRQLTHQNTAGWKRSSCTHTKHSRIYYCWMKNAKGRENRAKFSIICIF